jgi:hypothetical protein
MARRYRVLSTFWGGVENDLTAALAFALASSPGLLALTLRRVI